VGSVGRRVATESVLPPLRDFAAFHGESCDTVRRVTRFSLLRSCLTVEG